MPRSPSRDRSDRYAGHRGYYRRGTPVGRGKVLLAAVGLVLAVGWAAADALWPEPMHQAHTHGELTSPHAAFADRCELCHRPFDGTDLSPFAAGTRWRTFACEQCHAGPAHHPFPGGSADEQANARCGDCHHDHQGRGSRLTRLADSHCTGCHADLSKHPSAKPTYPGESPIAASVTHFATDHPQFLFRGRGEPPAPRTLKFSHALHMTRGVTYQKGASNELTPGFVRRAYGEGTARRFEGRYEPTEEGGVVKQLLQLDCRDCHQLDAGAGDKSFDLFKDLLEAKGEPVKSVLPARADGRHFLPVNFEAHCRACHPVNAPPRASGERVLRGFELPHRLDTTDRKELRTFLGLHYPGPPLRTDAASLDEVLAAGYLRGLLSDGYEPLRTPLSPGGGSQPAARTAREEVVRLADGAAGQVREGCVKCHDLARGTIAPVPDRTVWLRSARFDHTAHRAVKCADCHPGTYRPVHRDGRVNEAEAVTDNILGREACVKCHSPAGGVRHGCTDCHSYHNGDHPLQGRGAPPRGPAPDGGTQPSGVADLLRK